MKRLLGLTITFAAILILTGCPDEVTPEAPDVEYKVGGTGDTLKLSWAEVADADGYIIYADGAVIDTIDALTFNATKPAKVYEVSAYAGDNESEKTKIDCTPKETPNLTVWGLSDPDPAHPSGLGFTTDGTAVTYSVQEANYAKLDFVFDDKNFAQLHLVSPNAYEPALNDEDNTSVQSGTDFDGLHIAAPLGDYSTQTKLASGAVYSLWIDPDYDGWDAQNDHFGKMKIESIEGTQAPYKATITCAYQKIPGLRWLVTK